MSVWPRAHGPVGQRLRRAEEPMGSKVGPGRVEAGVWGGEGVGGGAIGQGEAHLTS